MGADHKWTFSATSCRCESTMCSFLVSV